MSPEESQWDSIRKGRSPVDDALMMRKFFPLCQACATSVHLRVSYSCCGLQQTLPNEKGNGKSCTCVNNRSGLVVQPFKRDCSAFLKLFVLAFYEEDFFSESENFAISGNKRPSDFKIIRTSSFCICSCSSVYMMLRCS